MTAPSCHTWRSPCARSQNPLHDLPSCKHPSSPDLRPLPPNRAHPPSFSVVLSSCPPSFAMSCSVLLFCLLNAHAGRLSALLGLHAVACKPLVFLYYEQLRHSHILRCHTCLLCMRLSCPSGISDPVPMIGVIDSPANQCHSCKTQTSEILCRKSGS